MTFELLKKIIEENNIPEDVTLQSNSGWECCETEMDGIWYHKGDNVIRFTQDGTPNPSEVENGFKLLYGEDYLEQLRKRKKRRMK